MYQPYPSGGQPQPLQPMTPPPSVQNAVRLMYVGAALSAVELVVGLLTIHSLKTAIIQAANRANTPVTTSQVNTAVAIAVTIVVIIGALGIGLWIGMALANRKGWSWARIVATVLFGLNTVSLLAAVARPHTGLGLAFSGLVWLVGLGAIVFMWQRASTAFYQASSGQPRYS